MKSVIACVMVSVAWTLAHAEPSTMSHSAADPHAKHNHLFWRANIIEAGMGNVRKGGAMTPAAVQDNASRLARLRHAATADQRKALSAVPSVPLTTASWAQSKRVCPRAFINRCRAASNG